MSRRWRRLVGLSELRVRSCQLLERLTPPGRYEQDCLTQARDSGLGVPGAELGQPQLVEGVRVGGVDGQRLLEVVLRLRVVSDQAADHRQIQQADSLNVAMATIVTLFEAVRQRTK